MAKIHCRGRAYLYTMCGRLEAEVAHSVDEEIWDDIKAGRKCRKCVCSYFYQLLQDKYTAKEALEKLKELTNGKR